MLVPNRETGAIEENWNEMIAGQTPGDAPLVCVVPDGGVIQSGAPVTDLMGVTYTPVRLPGGLSAYRNFQPNNDHYAKIVESNITDDLNSSPKTTTAWAKGRFIDKVATERIGRTPRVFVVEDVAVMEMEVQKTTRWGSPLSAPEFEFQARVATYGAEFQNARAVFLPDRLIEGTEWATVRKSGSSQNQLGPTNPVRAAAIPGLAPMTYIARVASLVSKIPGLSSIGVGVDNFYKNNGFEIDLFEGLIGNFHAFDDNPHFVHSEEMFRPGEKTQTERPSFGWWWWPTRTGTPIARRLYTSLHFLFREGSRSVEALFYLFKFADTVPPITEASEDGIRHCYEWLVNSSFDGSGVSYWGLEGNSGDLNQWGEHTGSVGSGRDTFPTAFALPNIQPTPQLWATS